ncbi:MAG: ATPase domain-containing protein [Chloroflexota bacterium]
MPTGIRGLDTILHGGFFSSGIYLIAGEPGSGKTILSNQIAFNHVASGGRVVFTSLLSETHARMFAQLSSLSFFDEGPIGGALYYISGYGVLQKDGLKGLLSLLQSAIQDHQATLLVIDGIMHAEPFASSGPTIKEFVHSLHQYAEASGCTILLLSSRGSGTGSGTGNGNKAVESDRVSLETTVDGVIELCRERVGMQSVLELEVQKFRGSAHRRGAHTMEITGNGIEVYPRTELLLSSSASSASSVQAIRTGPASRERLPFGIERLDEMLLGGLLHGSTTVLLGPPGSGKTLLGLHFLAEGARRDEPGLYFGLNEPPPLVIDAADEIGLDFTGFVSEGRIEIFWQPALEASLDLLAQDVLATVRERGVKRLFIDGLDAFSDVSAYSERLALFLTALTYQLRALGVTTLTSVELEHLFGPTVEIPIKGVFAIVENIIFLRYVELRAQLYRFISVLKARRSKHDLAIREFTIGEAGIEVSDALASAEAILTGLARPLPLNEEPIQGTR